MAARICIYEDRQVDRLFPLVYFRPAYDLRCGISTLREKIARAFPKTSIALHTRPYLADVVRQQNPRLPVNENPRSDCLFVNGRVVADSSLPKKLASPRKSDVAFVSQGTIVGAFVGGARLEKLKDLPSDSLEALFGDLPKQEVDVRVVSYPWDVVHLNGPEIVRDFEILLGAQKRTKQRKPSGTYFVGRKGVFIAKTAVVQPGVVFDAERGPIYIGPDARIMPFTTVVGPASIGDHTLVKAGSSIYENTSIGPVCKVGGEIEGSIIHGYSNKQHAGFLGHSYLGSWVNLGADTNTSDLKNNYGTVRVQTAKDEIDTGLQFVGLTMGDHSKSAINSMFNTGTVVGVSSNVADAGFPPKYVPSFSWIAPGGKVSPYKVERAIEVARKVMARRNVTLTQADEILFRTVFELTNDDRRNHGVSAVG